MNYSFRWVYKNGEKVLQSREGFPHYFEPTILWKKWKDIPTIPDKVYFTANLKTRQVLEIKLDDSILQIVYSSNATPIQRLGAQYIKNSKGKQLISIGKTTVSITKVGNYYIYVEASAGNTSYDSKLTVVRTSLDNFKDIETTVSHANDQEFPSCWKIDFEDSK